MTLVQWIVVIAAALGIATILFGLASGRLDRKAESCCTSDPAKDLRMRDAFAPADRGAGANETDTPAIPR